MITGKIVSLKDRENGAIFPQTSAQAVYMDNGKTLEELTDQGIFFSETTDVIQLSKPEIIEKVNSIENSINNIVIDIERFRTSTNTDDDILAIAIEKIQNGGSILLSKDEYNFTKNIVLVPSVGDSEYAPNTKFKIYSNKKTKVNYSGTGTFITLGKSSWGTTNLSQGYIDVELENLRIRYYGSDVNSIGIDVLNVRKIKFKNIEVRAFKTGIHTLNVWNSGNMEEVIIWNADKSKGGTGLHVDRATNNISYRNCAILGMDIGVLVRGVDTLAPVGHIYTNLFTNLDCEYNKIGILIDPQRCNVANVKFDTCHFENNDYHIVTYQTNTIWNLKIENTYFLNGDINIASKTDKNESSDIFGTGAIYGGGIFNSYICNGKFRLNKEELITIKNFENKGNNYYGTAGDDLPSSIVTNSLSTAQTEAVMPRYEYQPITPTRYDDWGKNGDIKWDRNNIYIRNQQEWRMIPTTKRNSMKIDEQIKLSGILNVEQRTISAWGYVDIFLTIQGVNFDNGWVIKMTPRKWLENGVNYCCWISAENTATLRLFASGKETSIAAQEWYFIAERISDTI